MGEAERGVVAAGHPLTARAGASVLREGGNAVDATVAAMLTSFVTESLLTGLGAGGYMLVAGAGLEPTLLDFFVAAPTRLGDGSEVELLGVGVSFGDAEQVFHIGPASCGVYGVPAGVCEAVRRWGTVPLEDLAAPAAALAREGVVLNAGQAYVAEILVELLTSTPESPRCGRRTASCCARVGCCATPTWGTRCCAFARWRRAVLPRRDRDVGVRLAERARWLAAPGGPRALRRDRA